MKEEILKCISEIKIETTDFDHDYGYHNFTSASASYEFETENYLVKLKICETAKWSDVDFYETDSLEIDVFEVYTQDGIVECDITDEEIIRHLKY